MKSFILAIIIAAIFSIQLFSQSISSIEGGGGIIAPSSSINGFTGTFQANFITGGSNEVYINLSAAGWGENALLYTWKDGSVSVKAQDSHALYGVSLGDRLMFYRKLVLRPFVGVELGYRLLRFNQFDLAAERQSNGYLKVSSIHNNENSVSQNALGVGIGGGFVHPISRNIDLVLSVYLNSLFNSGYHGFFTARNFYTRYSANIRYNLESSSKD